MKVERKTHVIDAENKVWGRLASQIAFLLQGKQKPNFRPNVDLGDFVIVKNVKKMKITGKKLENKKYYRYTGYPGGIKETKLRELFQKNPQELLRRTVLKMLPKNRLRKFFIKRLKFE